MMEKKVKKERIFGAGTGNKIQLSLKLTAVNFLLMVGIFLSNFVVTISIAEDIPNVKVSEVVEREDIGKVDLKEVPPHIRVDKDKIILENTYFLFEISLEEGIYLQKIINKYINYRCFKPISSPLFSIIIGQEQIDSSEFKIEDVRVIKRESLVNLQLLLSLIRSDISLSANLNITIKDSPETTWSLSIGNMGKQEINIGPIVKKGYTLIAKDMNIGPIVSFPTLNGIQIGDSLEDNYYILPILGGTISNHPVDASTPYGGFYQMQILDVYNPSEGGGISLWVNDNRCRSKIFSLKKTVSGKAPRTTWYFLPIFSSNSESTDSINMVVHYPIGTLSPGSRFQTPETIVAVHQGDFHEPMERYRKWVNSWFRKRHTKQPEWFREVFWIGSLQEHVNYKYADIGILLEKDHDKLPDGGVIGASWTEWSKLGGRGEPVKEIPEEVIKKYFCWEGHDVILDGSEGAAWRCGRIPEYADREIYHEPGSIERIRMGLPWNYRWYGDWEYNKEFGGRVGLRNRVKKLHEKGLWLMLYMEGMLLHSQSKLAKEHGLNWAAAHDDGTPVPHYWGPEQTYYSICPSRKGWQNHLAKVCARVFKDIGIEAIYLDSVFLATNLCANPEHGHKHPLEWGNGAAKLIKEVRTAVDKINPDVSLGGESASSEVVSQYLDYALDYTPIEEMGINLFRFYFPEVKIFRTFPDLFYQNLTLFNGMGLYQPGHAGSGEACSMPWGLFGRNIIPEVVRIIRTLRENGDAFSTENPVPLVKTEDNNILANMFSLKNKTIYTIYNRQEDKTIKGELLRIPHKEGYHYIDLLNFEEIEPKIIGREARLFLEIGPRGVTCVGQLFKMLQVDKTESMFQIRIKEKMNNPTLKIMLIPEGNILAFFADKGNLERKIEVEDKIKVDLKKIFDGKDGRVVIHLLDDKGFLVDAKVLK